MTVHGPMPMAGTLFSAPKREDDRRRTFAVLCDGFSTGTFPPIQGDILCHGEVVKGRLVGGNLTCLLIFLRRNRVGSRARRRNYLGLGRCKRKAIPLG